MISVFVLCHALRSHSCRWQVSIYLRYHTSSHISAFSAALTYPSGHRHSGNMRCCCCHTPFVCRLNKTQIILAAIFDLLTSQCDRHAQNLFIDEVGSRASLALHGRP